MIIKHSNHMIKSIKIIVSIFVTILLFQGTLLSQLHKNLRNEIIVYIKPHALLFPASEKSALKPTQLNISSPALQRIIDGMGVKTVAKAFPEFLDSDTTRITEVGKIVKIPHFSRIFLFHINNATDVDSTIAQLNRLPSVLYAEKHMEIYTGSDDHYYKQWHLSNTGQAGGSPGADINAEAAWSVYSGNSNIKIAPILGWVGVMLFRGASPKRGPL